MSDEQKEPIDEVLEEALALPPAQRPNYVSAACERDPEIAAELTSLLQSEQDASLTEFLDEGLPKILMSAAASAPESMRANETTQLRREEQEERSLWEGKCVGDEFDNQGRYEMVTMRRFGLMASLFFARDRKVGGSVVIKIPRRSAYLTTESDYQDLGNYNANIRNNFRREFDALRKLQRCSFVVRVLDFGELPDGRPFMVQEFIEGKNALELLNAHKELSGKSTGLAFKDVINIVRQAGKGLQAAHELSILHRDMKAENVMVTHDGHVKLIDFNAADVKLPISPMSTVFSHQTWGTLGYASPEQLQNMMDSDVEMVVPLTPASDVYSLAVTTYQLLTGKMPFSNNVTELIKQQALCSFVLPSEIRPGVSREIDGLFKSALHPDRALRPQTVQEFATTFARDLEDVGQRSTEPAHSEIDSLPEIPSSFSETPVRNEKKRKRALFAVILISILSVGGLLTWLALKDRNTQTAVSHASASLRSFSYWLDLTRVAKGRAADTKIRASGQEVFTNGDHFTVNFSSPYPGYLYLLNEGRNYQDKTSFYYIGKYTVKPDTQVSSSQLGFDNKDGTEQFWFVFSRAPIDIFEEHAPPLEIPHEKTLLVQTYLNQSVPADLTSTEDMSNAQTRVTGSGEVIAHKVSLRHRRSE
jgi:serine/threonine protein kinase